MEVVGGDGRLRKPRIMVRPVLRLEKRIRDGNLRDPFAAQLLDEPILVGAMMALDAAFRLGRAGRDNG